MDFEEELVDFEEELVDLEVEAIFEEDDLLALDELEVLVDVDLDEVVVEGFEEVVVVLLVFEDVVPEVVAKLSVEGSDAMNKAATDRKTIKKRPRNM